MGKSPTRTTRHHPHTMEIRYHLHHRHRTTAFHSLARRPRILSVPTSTTIKSQGDLCLCLVPPGARVDAIAVAIHAIPDTTTVAWS
jgi:hypothetical protein